MPVCWRELLVQFLQRSHEMTGLRNDLFQARQLARQMQDQVLAVSDERQNAQAQLAVLRENADRDLQQIARLAVNAAAHDAAKNALIELGVENEQLKENARRAGVAFAEREQARTGELRLALEEIALFQEALQDAEEKITSLKTDQVDASPSDEQFETIASIGKDLRQPLASIGGYADVLLGESIGILGTNQRKLLERIKVSTERMSRLLDELYQATAPESNIRRLEFSALDVGEVVQSAKVAVENLLARRRITIQLAQTADAVQIQSDVHAVKKIVVELFKNAGLGSPKGAAISMKTRVKLGENDLDYVLLQVEDQGGGIPRDELTHVFLNKVRPPQGKAGGAPNIDPAAIAGTQAAPELRNPEYYPGWASRLRKWDGLKRWSKSSAGASGWTASPTAAQLSAYCCRSYRPA